MLLEMADGLQEAVSDARKRALRLFGNRLGNCLYDKQHLKKISKDKLVKWKITQLNPMPIQQRTIEEVWSSQSPQSPTSQFIPLIPKREHASDFQPQTGNQATSDGHPPNLKLEPQSPSVLPTLLEGDQFGEFEYGKL